LLDVHPDQALTAIAQKDRLEAAGAEVHERAREEFLLLAAREPEHYLVLAAREDRAALAERVLARVSALLAARGMSDQAGTLTP
jgi:dTMP kinase